MDRIRTGAIFLFTFLFISSTLTLSNPDNGKVPLSTKSDKAKELLRQARTEASKFDYVKAVDLYTQAVQEDPDFAMAYLERAYYQPSGEEFLKDLQKAESLSGNISEGEKMLIEIAKADVAGDAEKQKQLWKQVISSYPDDELLRFQAGTFYTRQQNYDMAITHLNKVIEINPNFAPAYNSLGYANLASKKLDDAETAFKKYISLAPNEANPYDSYAEFLLQQGKYDEALQNYRKALSVNPDFIQANRGIAAAYIYQGKYDEARNVLNDVNNKAKTDDIKQNGHRIMAVSYIYEGNLDKALDELQKEYAVAQTSNDYANMSSVQNAMGMVLFENGKYDEAKQKFQASLDDFDKSSASQDVKTSYRNSLSYTNDLIAVKQNQQNTSAAAKSNTDMNSKDKDMQVRINAVSAIENNDADKCITVLKQANQEDPYNHFLLGKAYQLKGDSQNASTHLEKAMSYNGLPNINSALAYYNAKNLTEEKK